METLDAQSKPESSSIKEKILEITSTMTPFNDNLQSGKVPHKIFKQEVRSNDSSSLISQTASADMKTQPASINATYPNYHKNVSDDLVPTKLFDDTDSPIKKEVQVQDETDDLENVLHTCFEVKDEPSSLSFESECDPKEILEVQNYPGGNRSAVNHAEPAMLERGSVIGRDMTGNYGEYTGMNSNAEFKKSLNAFVKLEDIFPPQMRESGRAHTNSVQCLCIYCNREANRRNKSTGEHTQKNIGKNPFICSHCSASFDHGCHLNQHMRAHTCEKPFRCSHCSASFARKCNLNVHMRTHTGEKPFRCSHCSARFTVKCNLNLHTRTHTGEKPFRCGHCSASFAQKGYLKLHTRTHTGEKPFRCSHCSASFARKAYLNLHMMRKHTGE